MLTVLYCTVKAACTSLWHRLGWQHARVHRRVYTMVAELCYIRCTLYTQMLGFVVASMSQCLHRDRKVMHDLPYARCSMSKHVLLVSLPHDMG